MKGFLRTFKWFIYYKLQLWIERFKNPHSTILAITYANNRGQFSIGKGVMISNGNTIHVVSYGDNIGKLHIGDGTYIGECCNIRACGGEIHIGKKCLIAEYVTLVAANHGIKRDDFIINQEIDTRKVGINIAEGAWIASHAVILPGVNIGEGAVVGAGSIVTKDVPPYAIVCGNPAKVIKYRE